MYNKITLSVNKDFVFFLSYWYPVISFGYLIAVSKISSITMNRYKKEWTDILLFLILVKIFWFFSPLTLMLVIDLLWFFIMLRCVPFIPSSQRNFIMKECWTLLMAVSASNEMIKWSCAFVFQSAYVVSYIYWLTYNEQCLHLGKRPMWSWWIILNVFLHLVWEYLI